MLIDKILARFKIQTKVLVFILPFVLSICAVGFTGLYASGLLQGRMEISNSVLQSLSGFKDVYAGMNRFLQNTSEENRDAVHQRLTAHSLYSHRTDPQPADRVQLRLLGRCRELSIQLSSSWRLAFAGLGSDERGCTSKIVRP